MKKFLSLITAGTLSALTLRESQPSTVAPPLTWIGFADASGAVWPSDDWTNCYRLVALTSPDLNAPLSQWASNSPALQIHNGALAFQLPMDGLRGFVRALYIYQGGGQ